MDLPKFDDKRALQEARAIGYENTFEPDIKGKLHAFFNRSRWNVTDSEYDSLLPSMRLATQLLLVGLPYLASFNPSAIYGKSLKTVNDDTLCPIEIPLKENPTRQELQAARDELLATAASTTWEVNYEMYTQVDRGATLHWCGMTRLADFEHPWISDVDEAAIRAADKQSKKKKLKRRPLIIGIMGEYVEAIESNPPDSEASLRATFLAAITMVHEIGHAIFHQDFRSLNAPSLQEPYVGDDLSAELGVAFISWIFTGLHPRADGDDDMDFQSTLFWEPTYSKKTMSVRPLYKDLYSISIPYIQKTLTQSFWRSIEVNTSPAVFSARARSKLSPDLRDAAKASTPNWYYSSFTSTAEWKDSTFRLPNYQEGNRVLGLSHDEIAFERAKSFAGSVARVTKDQVEQATDDSEYEDDDDDDDVEERDLINNTREIDDGFLEPDVLNTKESDSTLTTRIEVLYVVRPNRDQVYFEESSTIGAKHPDHAIASGIFGIKPDHGSALAFLRSTTPLQVSGMTRIKAHSFCLHRNLVSYPDIPSTQSWQQSELDLTNAEDMAIVQRICENLLNEACEHLSALDVIRLKIESRERIKDWGQADLKAFCKKNRRKGPVSIEELIRAAEEIKRHEIFKLQLDYRYEFPETDRELFDVELDDLHLSTEKMSDTQLHEYCYSCQLPVWGLRKALIARVKQDKKNDLLDFYEKRDPQRHRTNVYGETYVFRAVLAHSTVLALKSALFIRGQFEPDTDLKLYFHPHLAEPLDDDKPLAFYAEKDWTQLRLLVSRNSPTQIEGSTDEPPTKKRKVEATPEQMRAELLAKTERHIAVDNRTANPTVAELLKRILDRAPVLNDLVKSASTNPRSPQLLETAVQIYEELQDFEDSQKAVLELRNTLQLQEAKDWLFQGKKRRREKKYIRPLSSHMGDIAIVVKAQDWVS